MVQNILPKHVNCIFVRQPLVCAVLLADGLIVGDVPITKQLVDVHNQTLGSVLAVQDVQRELTRQYGAVAGTTLNDRLTQVLTWLKTPLPKSHHLPWRWRGVYVYT